MCGIAGFFAPEKGRLAGLDVRTVTAMADAMHHRGPDDGGSWIDDNNGVALGHRRLSIIDLSPLGHQPMISASGRTVIVYNGEVFNHAELRAQLQLSGVRFRGNSDTEVILEACELWGVETTARRLIGMFAFGLWDRNARTLTLVRDRLGIKPLYWGEQNGVWLFASELKGLRKHPAFQAEINRDAVAALLRYNYVPGPMSIYRGIHKLKPGTMVVLSGGKAPQHISFWSMEQVAVDGALGQMERWSDSEAEERLEALLLDAIKRRMVADVPLGAFLSGGIDSSTVVALMQAQSKQPIRTFSIGSVDKSYDESVYARAVATHLGTDHTELHVDPKHALELIPRLPQIYDEPFADSSQIPTYLVCELTKRHVTVALSGDGGDELFAGYNRHVLAQSFWPWISRIPTFIRSAAATGIRFVPPARWDWLQGLAPTSIRRPHVGDKMHKLSRILVCDEQVLYEELVSQWSDSGCVALGSNGSTRVRADHGVLASLKDPALKMQYLDAINYLPDDILAKVDRASMAVSLEARVPLLDHRLVEFAWRLPIRFRIRDGRSKWLLRRVLGRYVPGNLFERPKMGFAIPLHAWLRGPLRDWAEGLLAEDRLHREGFLRPQPVRQRWKEHLSGSRNWQESLWAVLMFQAWLEHQS